jgi:hypothetical protein
MLVPFDLKLRLIVISDLKMMCTRTIEIAISIHANLDSKATQQKQLVNAIGIHTKT